MMGRPDVRTYLKATFRTRRIGRGKLVRWIPRSVDLSPLDYFLCRHLKNLVYKTPLDSDEDLVALTSEAAARVRKIPGFLERVR